MDDSNVLKEPTPHFVLDHFLPLSFADKLYKELRHWEVDSKFYKYDNPLERKFACDKWEMFPANVHHFMLSTLGGPFISMIEKRLNLKGLIADPNLRGAGFHCHLTGGKLDVHTDFTYHKGLKLWRRVNAILFLNKTWDDESWNGSLELWNKDMTLCVRRIPPKFNRLVVFETPNAPHGLPDPITCPKEHRRMSLACYLYSVDKPESISDEHTSTTFLKRPQDPENAELDELRQKRSKGRLSSNV